MLRLILLLPLLASTMAQVSIVEQWNGGFKGQIQYKLPYAVNGWKMTLTFGKSISNFRIWSAKALQTSGSVIVIENLEYNKNLGAGSVFDAVFVVDGPTSDLSINLNGNTQPPTNRPPPPTNRPPPPGAYNYAEVLQKSILFYEAQRSGRLPQSTKQRIPWRDDSALNDGQDNGIDLTGGWYDAGDKVKFNFPMASAVTLLSWGIIDLEGGYNKAGQLAYARDSVRWPLDYFLKCVRTDSNGKTVIYGQVGNGDIDHAVWGRAEDMKVSRPSYKLTSSQPGSDLAGEMAAALAAGSLVFRSTDINYANQLLSAAEKAFQFADQYKGKYSDVISDAGKFYGSSGYNDELAWAATWLYRATGNNNYLSKAKQYLTSNTPWALSWDDKTVGAQLLLYRLTKSETHAQQVRAFLKAYSSIERTPKGFYFRSKWGSLRYTANTALIALLAANEGIDRISNIEWARGQIHYMLGDSGRSYVVGFGHNFPKQPHHGGASCPNRPANCDWNDFNSPRPNPQILYGALVGGPDGNDNYEDKRSDYVMNEVACDYNAGFQGAIAGLLHF